LGFGAFHSLPPKLQKIIYPEIHAQIFIIDWTLQLAQTFQRFQASPRRVIRPFPFADLRQFFIHLPVEIDAPKPFAMFAVNEVLLCLDVLTVGVGT
jgi:hypothetical protein